VGQRANLILVEGSGYQLFYSHWCANTLPCDLFWGPKHAIAFVRAQRLVDKSGWLDDIWAEGGALIDLNLKKLLLYGGEEFLYDVPLRRTYLPLLAHVWNGWGVRWAHQGIVDLAERVGYPRDRVLTKDHRHSTIASLAPPEQKDWTDLVASVHFGQGLLRFYPLTGDVASYLSNGPNLIDSFSATGGYPQLYLDEWTTEFPTGGFHLDIQAKRLDYWEARDAPNIGNHVAAAWPGWETVWQEDRYEIQLERAEGQLRFPVPDRQILLDRCRTILLQEACNSPIETLKMLVQHDREQGKEVSVNPWALREDRLELSMENRLAILNEAISPLH
jgi:hypothetical protein